MNLAEQAAAPTISKEEIEFIMKLVKSLEESSLLIKYICQTVENEVKEQRGGFLGILLGLQVQV